MKLTITVLGFLLATTSAYADQSVMSCGWKFDVLEVTKTATNYQFVRSTGDTHLGQGADGHLTGQKEIDYSAEFEGVVSVQKTATSLTFNFNDGKSATLTLVKGVNGTQIQVTSDIAGLAERFLKVMGADDDNNDLFYGSCTIN